jgi:hypothetical protein
MILGQDLMDDALAIIVAIGSGSATWMFLEWRDKQRDKRRYEAITRCIYSQPVPLPSGGDAVGNGDGLSGSHSEGS